VHRHPQAWLQFREAVQQQQSEPILGIDLATDQQPRGLQHVVTQLIAASTINTGRYFASRVMRLISVRETGEGADAVALVAALRNLFGQARYGTHL
jgi:hypothetical protein